VNIKNQSVFRTFLLLSIFLLCVCSCSQKVKNPSPPDKKYLAFILAGQNAGSGIYYHLLNPAVELQLHPGACITTDSSIIDVNGDGIEDFILKQARTCSYDVYILLSYDFENMTNLKPSAII
jgi:hypothetical protein